MVRTLLAGLALAVVALWAHEDSRRISEKHIRAHVREQMDAMGTFDSATLCAPMTADFRLVSVEHVDGVAHRATLDRAAACSQLEDALALLRMLSNRTGGLLRVDFDVRITRVEVAPGGRRATVEATSTARLGGQLLSRTRGSAEYSRSLWKVREHGGTANTWLYVE